MKKVFIFILLTFLFVVPTVSEAQTDNGYKELDAISNRCIGTMPKELCPEVPKDNGILASIIQSLVSLFWDVDSSANLNQAVEHAKAADQTYIPVEEASSDAQTTLNNSLCGEKHTGIYTNFLPAFSDSTQEVKECEENYDIGLAPEGVNVIIP